MIVVGKALNVRNIKKSRKNLNFALACCVNELNQCILKQNL
jgi:hypothetical protein